MYHIPERQKKKIEIDSIYYNENHRNKPQMVIDKMQKLLDKAKESKISWLDLWWENSYSVDHSYDSSEVEVDNFCVILMGERWETDEEYKATLERAKLYADRAYNDHKKLMELDDVWLKEKALLEKKIASFNPIVIKKKKS
jgi:hypothetical protein